MTNQLAQTLRGKLLDYRDPEADEFVRIGEVVDAFSKTAFWNCSAGWPEGKGEAEYPCDVVVQSQAAEDPDDAAETRYFVRLAGEHVVASTCSYSGSDGDTAAEDAEFIAKLPVIIPALLTTVCRLARENDELRAAIDCAIENQVGGNWDLGTREFSLKAVQALLTMTHPIERGRQRTRLLAEFGPQES